MYTGEGGESRLTDEDLGATATPLCREGTRICKLSKDATREGDDLQNPKSLSAQLQHRVHPVFGGHSPPLPGRGSAGKLGTAMFYPPPSFGAEDVPGCSDLLPSNRFVTASRDHLEEQKQEKEKG